MMRAWILLAALAISAGGPAAWAQDFENERLSGKTFRRGLKQLGLIDLLEYFILEFPPKDPVQAALLRRELRLNLYSDPTVPAAERLLALADATVILRELIGTYPDHDARFDWELDLGRDLIFREAEPYRNNIMFRGGSPEDRLELSRITTEALKVYDQLGVELNEAEARIDDLSVKQFEKLAKSGYISRIENSLPKAKYFRLWASYYHCLTLDEDSAGLAAPLNEIVRYLNEDAKLTTIAHATSHYQAQSLLLCGMAYRLLKSADRAEEYLFRAGSIVEEIPNFTERRDLKWVVMFAALERVRNFRDTGRYKSALATLDEFRDSLPSSAPGTFSLHFALALLEGTVYRSQVEHLPSDDVKRRAELGLKSRQALISLARAHPRYQDEIYVTLFELLGEVDDLSSLDPFQQNVYLAGLLREAREVNDKLKRARSENQSHQIGKLERDKGKVLERAAKLATRILETGSVLARELHPEARFNLAVCRFEQGMVLEAVEQFVRVAKEHPSFGKSEAAIEYAVRLSESLYSRSRKASRSLVRGPYLNALQTLTKLHSASPLASERLFTYAKLLQEDGQFREAAAQYVLVPSGDQHYLQALFGIAECNLLQLRRMDHTADGRAGSAQAEVTLSSASRFRDKLADVPSQAKPRLLARSLLLSAEANMLRPAQNPQAALQLLARFESEFPELLELIGRAMRLRILAYQALGNLQQAAAIIPDYIERDPINAGATLQGLLETFKDEIALAERAGHQTEALSKAEDALLVAKSLRDWAVGPASGLDRRAQTALGLEYAEALLRTDRNSEALAIFRSTVDEEAGKQVGSQARNGRAIYGLARSYLQLQQPSDALKYFSMLYQQSPENSDLWWRAFLGEIQSRKALQQDVRTLYNLLRQKRVFYPGMGGPELKQEFERLQKQLSAKS